VTDAALAILDDDELSAICAPELAHLCEPRWVRAIRLSYGFLCGLYLSSVFLFRPLARSAGPEMYFLVLIGSPVALILIWTRFLRLVHRMEVRADVLARQPEAAPGTYSRALEKIYEANLVPVVLGSKRRTHPELYDRLVAAGATPAYPRPEAPPRGPWRVGFLVMVFGIAAGWFGLDWLAVTLL
jgi:Zn-dependent protease with chaperone function